MNKKETIHALELLDACIDSARQPELMLALDALRGTLMQLWQESGCCRVEADALLKELDGLPALCGRTENHPALPTKLCQAMFILCAPAMEPERALGLQCREQAEKIRRLRQWQQEVAALLAIYDEETRREAEMLQAEGLAMMSEVFMRFLAVYRGSMAEAASRLRSARLEEIRKYREAFPLEDISDAAAESRTISEMTKEKFSEFAAEIAGADFLNIAKGQYQRPEKTVQEPEWLPGINEEEV